jgi:hypothetical protein
MTANARSTPDGSRDAILFKSKTSLTVRAK